MASLSFTTTSKNIWTFDPRTIPGCVLWLDGADLNTLFQDTAGTVPVTANGQNVEFWKDKSTQGNNAIGLSYVGSSTTVTYPTYSSSSTGVVFTSASSTSGQGLYSALSASSAIATGFAVLIDSNLAPSYAGSIIGGTPSGSSTNTGGRQWRISGTQLQMNNGGITGGQTANLSAFSSNKGLVNFTDSGATPLAYYEFGNTLTTAGTYNATYTTSRITTVGCRGGSSPGGYSEFLNGTILELIIFNTNLTTIQRQQIEGYLSWKWNLQSKLPLTHPYNNGTGSSITYPSTGVGSVIKPYARNFVPTDIPGISLWLDAGDATTIIQSSGSVSQWNDKSGNGYNPTASGATQPTYTANSIYFPTASQYLSFSGAALSLTANIGFCSCFLVYNLTANQTAAQRTYIFEATTNAGTTRYGLFLTNGSNPDTTTQLGWLGRNTDAGSSGGFQASNTSNNVLTLALSEINYLTNTGTIYANGTSSATTSSLFGTGGVNTSNTASTNMYINGTPGNIGVYVYEIIVFTTPYTVSQRQQIEGYLAWKWGIASSLPSTHPFYSIPTNTVVPFNPFIISGLIGWYDASDTATVANSGLSSFSWSDKSGVTVSARHSTGYPTIVSNAVNNLQAVLCNGNTQSIEINSGASNSYIATSGQITLFIVISPNTTAGSSFADISSFARFSVYWTPSVPSLTFSIWGTSSSTITPSGSTISNTFLCTLTSAGLSSTGTLLINGTSVGTITTGSSVGAGYLQPAFARDNTGAEYFCECITYNTLLTTLQRQQVEGYLAWKWGLSSTLPTTHPYYKIRP